MHSSENRNLQMSTTDSGHGLLKLSNLTDYSQANCYQTTGQPLASSVANCVLWRLALASWSVEGGENG